jgi:hypothetical protein
MNRSGTLNFNRDIEFGSKRPIEKSPMLAQWDSSWRIFCGISHRQRALAASCRTHPKSLNPAGWEECLTDRFSQHRQEKRKNLNVLQRFVFAFERKKKTESSNRECQAPV